MVVQKNIWLHLDQLPEQAVCVAVWMLLPVWGRRLWPLLWSNSPRFAWARLGTWQFKPGLRLFILLPVRASFHAGTGVFVSGSSGLGVKSSWCNELLLALLGFGWIVFLTIGSVRVVVGGGAVGWFKFAWGFFGSLPFYQITWVSKDLWQIILRWLGWWKLILEKVLPFFPVMHWCGQQWQQGEGQQPQSDTAVSGRGCAHLSCIILMFFTVCSQGRCCIRNEDFPNKIRRIILPCRRQHSSFFHWLRLVLINSRALIGCYQSGSTNGITSC